MIQYPSNNSFFSGIPKPRLFDRFSLKIHWTLRNWKLHNVSYISWSRTRMTQGYLGSHHNVLALVLCCFPWSSSVGFVLCSIGPLGFVREGDWKSTCSTLRETRCWYPECHLRQFFWLFHLLSTAMKCCWYGCTPKKGGLGPGSFLPTQIAKSSWGFGWSAKATQWRLDMECWGVWIGMKQFNYHASVIRLHQKYTLLPAKVGLRGVAG